MMVTCIPVTCMNDVQITPCENLSHTLKDTVQKSTLAARHVPHSCVEGLSHTHTYNICCRHSESGSTAGPHHHPPPHCKLRPEAPVGASE